MNNFVEQSRPPGLSVWELVPDPPSPAPRHEMDFWVETAFRDKKFAKAAVTLPVSKQPFESADPQEANRNWPRQSKCAERWDMPAASAQCLQRPQPTSAHQRRRHQFRPGEALRNTPDLQWPVQQSYRAPQPTFEQNRETRKSINKDFFYVNEFGDTICPAYEGVRVWVKRSKQHGRQRGNPWEVASAYSQVQPPQVWAQTEERRPDLPMSERFDQRPELSESGRINHFKSSVAWSSLGLPPEFLGVLSRCKCKCPSKMQADGLRCILGSTGHLLAQSPTGSGKTLTFVLGTLAQVNRSNPEMQVICVAPTNELISQLLFFYRMYARTIDVTVEATGKHWNSAQVTLMTALQFLYFLNNFNVPNLQFLVIDEADHLLSAEDMPRHAGEMQRLFAAVGNYCRVLLFSATFSDEILAIVDEALGTYERITVRDEDLVLDNIRLYYLYTLPGESKLDALERVLARATVGVTIIFVNSCNQAQLLVSVLNRRGRKTALMAGGVMTMQERKTTLESFRCGLYSILVATDVLARGIDDTRVSRVVNYDIPIHWSTRLVDAETFLHRVGRAGRFARAAEAITIVTCEAELSLLEDVMMQWGCQINCL